jgi:hypothetical protein
MRKIVEEETSSVHNEKLHILKSDGNLRFKIIGTKGASYTNPIDSALKQVLFTIGAASK